MSKKECGCDDLGEMFIPDKVPLSEMPMVERCREHAPLSLTDPIAFFLMLQAHNEGRASEEGSR